MSGRTACTEYILGLHRRTGVPSKNALSETLYATASATSEVKLTFAPAFSMTERCLA